MTQLADVATTAQSLPENILAETFDVKLGAIFAIATVSGLGLHYAQSVFKSPESIETLLFKAFKRFGGGLVLGVAVMHLLVDALAQFERESISIHNQGNPIICAIALFGIIFMMGLQVLTAFANNTDTTLTTERKLDYGTFILEDNEEQVLKVKIRKSIIKVLSFESPIVLHSTIIGFGLGAMKAGLLPPLIALLFHQFFEGIGLGIIILEAQHIYKVDFSADLKIPIQSLFVLSTPAGILLGMFTKETEAGARVSSVFNAFAAGLLIYGCIVGLGSCEDELSSRETKTNTFEKVTLYLAFVFGCLTMSLLAIWA